MAMLARRAGVDVDYLHTGRPSKRSDSSDNTDAVLEPRHRALLQPCLSLPDAQRLAVRMLIETLAGAQNPRMHRFMQQIEDRNHVRDHVRAPEPAREDGGKKRWGWRQAPASVSGKRSSNGTMPSPFPGVRRRAWNAFTTQERSQTRSGARCGIRSWRCARSGPKASPT